MPQQLRYEGSQLDDVLERVRDEHGPGARIVSADLARTKGLAGFFARETYQVTVELDPPPSIVPAAKARPAATQPAATRPAAARPAVAPATEPAHAPSVRVGSEPPPPQFRGAAGPGQAPEFARLLADMVEDSSSDLVPPPVPVSDSRGPASRAQHRSEQVRGERMVDMTDDESDRPRMITMSESVDHAPVALCELVGELSQLITPAVASPTRGVVAIVGARSDAVEVAVALAQKEGRAASDVLVAAPTDAGVTPRTVATIVSESGRRRIQRGLIGPVIVAVAIAPGDEGERWATETVAALDATQVRVAVGGWRPVERTVQHVAALRSVVGVDALDLVELEGAAAPEQFLRLGVPVGTIDGAEATATMWAALLLDCGRAAAIVESEIVLAPARRTSEVALDAPDVPVVPAARSAATAQPAPIEMRGPVPAVFPRVSVPVRR